MREKLIELIDEKQVYGIDIEQPRKHELQLLDNDELADHLIQNGVTIQKWIPVTELLPTYDDADENGDLIAHHKIRGVRVVCVDNITRNPERYTHWMSLPEPPKEVE